MIACGGVSVVQGLMLLLSLVVVAALIWGSFILYMWAANKWG